MTNEIILTTLLAGTFLILLLMLIIMWVYEERNRCKHIWEETNRSQWESDLYGDFTKVELKCRKCGDVESRRI